MTLYNTDFYATRDADTHYAADRILSLVIEQIPRIHSAVDICCGVGTWLAALKNRAVDDVHGVEGPWLDKSKLVIPPNQFTSFDFGTSVSLDLHRRFELAICIEAAEHIQPKFAADFVRLLTGLSDRVLFSAAIPGQGGYGHVNEQWPMYWAALFEQHGYAPVDTLRQQIWSDPRIQWWYRQNVMLFVKGGKSSGWNAAPLVHPECFRLHTTMYTSKALRQLKECLARAVKRRLHVTEATP